MLNKKKCRVVDGVLLMDKPIMMTSNAALQSVKRMYNAGKAGHTGSLDPLASGMLPMCFGGATKFSQFLLNSDKSYFVVAKLGVKTATGDSEGDIIRESEVKDISAEKLVEILDQFKGTIEQVPSMYSAIKHNGQPLYKLARKGIDVKRDSRKVSIYELNLLKFDTDNNLVEFKIHCSKGTYVRTLIDDIGDKLGCCAHVVALRRLSVGSYTESQMVSYKDIEKSVEDYDVLDSFLLPIESMLHNKDEVVLSESAIYYLERGQSIIAPYEIESFGIVKLVRKNGAFLGVGETLENGKIAPRRLLNLKSN